MRVTFNSLFQRGIYQSDEGCLSRIPLNVYLSFIKGRVLERYPIFRWAVISKQGREDRLIGPYVCREDIDSDTRIYRSRRREGISQERVRFFRNFPEHLIDWSMEVNLRILNDLLEWIDEEYRLIYQVVEVDDRDIIIGRC